MNVTEVSGGRGKPAAVGGKTRVGNSREPSISEELDTGACVCDSVTVASSPDVAGTSACCLSSRLLSAADAAETAVTLRALAVGVGVGVVALLGSAMRGGSRGEGDIASGLTHSSYAVRG